jgi:TPR repeat protein
MKYVNLVCILISGILFSISVFSKESIELEHNEESKPSELSNSLGCDQTCEDLFKKLKRFARNGSPHAQTLLAVSYKNGENGLQSDAKLAWKWIKRAATQRHLPALHIKSQWHRVGYASEPDIERADVYLERAAKYNYPAAIFDLAVLNFQRKNDELAFQHLNRVANMGYPKATKLMAALAVQIPTETQKLLDQQTAIQKSKRAAKKAKQDGEVITIVASQEDPVLLLGDLLVDINKTGIYNRRGTTGTRVGDKKCGQVGSRCRVEKADSYAFTLTYTSTL